MSAQYASIQHTQRALVANTVSSVVTLPINPSPGVKMVLTCPPTRTIPVYYLIRAVGSTTEPTLVAAGANGSGSPCIPVGLPADIAMLPSGTNELVLKSAEAGDVTIILYAETR